MVAQTTNLEIAEINQLPMGDILSTYQVQLGQLASLYIQDSYNFEIQNAKDQDIEQIIWKLLIGQADIKTFVLKLKKITKPIEPLLETMIQTAKERNVKELTIVFPNDYKMDAFLGLKEFIDTGKTKIIFEEDDFEQKILLKSNKLRVYSVKAPKQRVSSIKAPKPRV